MTNLAVCKLLGWLATYRHASLGNLFSEVVLRPQSRHLKNLFSALCVLMLWPSEMHRSVHFSAVYLHCMHQPLATTTWSDKVTLIQKSK